MRAIRMAVGWQEETKGGVGSWGPQYRCASGEACELVTRRVKGRGMGNKRGIRRGTQQWGEMSSQLLVLMLVAPLRH